MNRFLPLVFFLLSALGAAAQPKPAPALKHELDSIYVLDQHYRELMGAISTPRRADSLGAVFGVAGTQVNGHLIGLMLRVDSSNIRRIGQILRQYGYPGKSLVGAPANEAAFYVIQHSNRIPQYLPVVKQAAERGELPFRLYAMMLDRQLMYEGKAQVYGPQGRGFPVRSPATGASEFKMVIWPIKDPGGVNARRKAAGFDQTVEENAKRLGIAYRPLTLKEVRQMQNP